MLVQSKYYKIAVAVPSMAAEKVRAAMSAAGAGVQGLYDSCSFSVVGIGRFRPLTGANPAIGDVGELTEVAEETIFTLCHEEAIPAVLLAIKSSHPYEEPAIDIIPRFELK